MPKVPPSRRTPTAPTPFDQPVTRAAGDGRQDSMNSSTTHPGSSSTERIGHQSRSPSSSPTNLSRNVRRRIPKAVLVAAFDEVLSIASEVEALMDATLDETLSDSRRV